MGSAGGAGGEPALQIVVGTKLHLNVEKGGGGGAAMTCLMFLAVQLMEKFLLLDELEGNGG